jgi:hypothetical protein
MLKGVFFRALGTGKVTVLAVVAALTLFTASTALGATGGNFILGVANTATDPDGTGTATGITQLTANLANPAMKLINTGTGTNATALNLQTATTKPPMTVNSKTKVANLNADSVDNLSANQISRGGTDGDDTFTTITEAGQVVNDANFTAPQKGAFLVSWSAWKYCAGEDVAEAQLFLDGVGDGSFFVVPNCDPDPTDAGLSYGTESFQKLIPVAAGAHNLQIRAHDFDGAPNNMQLNDSRLDIVFIPFDATGGTTFAPLSPTTSAKVQSEAGPKDGPGVTAE